MPFHSNNRNDRCSESSSLHSSLATSKQKSIHDRGRHSWKYTTPWQYTPWPLPKLDRMRSPSYEVACDVECEPVHGEREACALEVECRSVRHRCGAEGGPGFVGQQHVVEKPVHAPEMEDALQRNRVQNLSLQFGRHDGPHIFYVAASGAIPIRRFFVRPREGVIVFRHLMTTEKTLKKVPTFFVESMQNPQTQWFDWRHDPCNLPVRSAKREDVIPYLPLDKTDVSCFRSDIDLVYCCSSLK